MIRHADPDYAHDTITELGHQQAAALARKLALDPPDRLYVSPMGRAQATAGYVVEATGLQPVTLSWLHELDANWTAGRWAWSVPGAEMLDTDTLPRPDDWQEHVPFGPLMYPQYRELAGRFDALLAEYGYEREGLRYRVRRPYDGTIACVCHGGVTLTLLAYLLNWPVPLVYVHLGCDPTGIAHLVWEAQDGYAVPRAVRINDTSHLG